MLTSLLPGLREIRAPLATGYVWLVAAWLAGASTLVRPRGSDGLLGDLTELADRVGSAATLAATTFVAYVVGVLSVEATAVALPVLRILRRRRVVGEGLRPGSATPSPAGRAALLEAVLDQVARRSESDPQLQRKLDQTRATCGEQRSLEDPAVRRALVQVRIDVDGYCAEVESDLPLMPLRLLAAERMDDVFGEFDRLRAEAEFRASVAVPLAALVGVLAWQGSPWALLGLVAPAHLVFEAKRNVVAATDVLAEYVRACPEESPVLARLAAGDLRDRTDWLTEAARRGFTGAMVSLARRLEDTNVAAAEEWYRSAAQGGDGPAALWLAGRLQRREDPEARQWYARAAEAGEPTAIAIQAAEREDAGGPGVTDLKLAHAGDGEAMIRMGDRMREEGEPERAEAWYRGAAQSGYRPGIEAYAGYLSSRDMHAAAAEWLRRLDEPGRSDAAGAARQPSGLERRSSP